MQKEEEVIKVVQREQHIQSEQFRKRLAERQRSKNNRSLSIGVNNSLSFNINGRRSNLNANEVQSNMHNNNFDTQSMGRTGFGSARRHLDEGKMASSAGFAGFPRVNINLNVYNNNQNGNDSFFSCGKSVVTTGGGLASKISMAISRVVWNLNNSSMNDDDDVADLINLIEELNSHTDLTVKLNNQSKICKILETNEDFNRPAA